MQPGVISERASERASERGPERRPERRSERRRSVRYIVEGDVIFHTGSPESSGTLVNIGRYGMLVRTNVLVPEGTILRVGFTVDEYPAELQGRSQVVRTSADLLAIQFLGEVRGMPQLLLWLERENVPWAGQDTPEGCSLLQSPQASEAGPASSALQEEREELEAILPLLDAMG